MCDDRTLRMHCAWGTAGLGLLVLALAGCGGGGGSTADEVTPPTPAARILFPPTVAVTNQASLTVRGTTSSSAEVAAVRVNGLLATTTDDFATWRRTVPLALGENELRVDIETKAGIVLPDSAKGSARRTAVFVANASSLDRDPNANVAYVHDRFEGLLRFEPASSTWTVVSPEGAYYSPFEATGGAFDPSTNDYYQLYHDELVRIDVQTGVRTSLAGGGPSIGSRAEDVDVDGSGNAFVVGDFIGSVDEGVLRVDLSTGDRFELSTAAVGAGTAFTDPLAIDVTGGGSGIYVYDGGPETLVQVDPVSGDRTVLIDASATFTTSSFDAVGLIVDPAGSRAYLSQDGVIYLLDWAGGTVTVVFDRAAGHEDELGDFQGIVRGPGDRLLAIDGPSRAGGGWTGLASIALGSGILTRHTDTSIGSGPAASLTILTDLVVDPVRQNLLLVDDEGYLTALDLGTGARSVVASDTVGSGPAVGSSPDALVFDGDRTAYVGTGDEVYSVDVETGARALVSDDIGVGTGPGFDTYGGLGWDPGAGRIVAGADVDDLLLRIDPATGNRVSFTTEALYDLYDMDLDRARGRIYLGTEYPPVNPSYQILTVDLATGVVSPFLDLGAGTSGGLGYAEMLASDAATGRLFVLEYPALVFEVDADTTATALLADYEEADAGVPGRNVLGMAAAPSTGVVYTATEIGVQALDAETGERVLIAK